MNAINKRFEELSDELADLAQTEFTEDILETADMTVRLLNNMIARLQAQLAAREESVFAINHNGEIVELCAWSARDAAKKYAKELSVDLELIDTDSGTNGIIAGIWLNRQNGKQVFIGKKN